MILIAGNEVSPAAQQRGCDTLDPKVAEVIDVSRRTVGPYKIDKEDLKRMRLDQFGGATSDEEERLLAVEEYLRCELKFDSGEVDKMHLYPGQK